MLMFNTVAETAPIKSRSGTPASVHLTLTCGVHYRCGAMIQIGAASGRGLGSRIAYSLPNIRSEWMPLLKAAKFTLPVKANLPLRIFSFIYQIYITESKVIF